MSLIDGKPLKAIVTSSISITVVMIISFLVIYKRRNRKKERFWSKTDYRGETVYYDWVLAEKTEKMNSV